MKFILVSGGVVSGLGKGISTSSIGLLLQKSGEAVTCLKIDPYLNVDSGLLSPGEHGETYVTGSGASGARGGESDLDLGSYERFLDVSLTGDHQLTTGKVYTELLKKERNGEYLGKTVQVVPHLTDLIIETIKKTARIPVSDGKKKGRIPEICLIELGGTVGDIESAPFVEALRQLRFKVGPAEFCHVHLTLGTYGGVCVCVYECVVSTSSQ
jgi:CTP synthase